MRILPCVYMRCASAGEYSRNRFFPRSSTYRLSWKSWCSPDEAGEAEQPSHRLIVCGRSPPSSAGRRGRVPGGSAESGGATSWSLEKVLYPPGLLISSGDAFAASFLAQTHVIFDSLVPLLLNFHAIATKEEFLAREYYDDLLIAKRRISDQLALVDSPMRPAALRLKTMASFSPHVLARQKDRLPGDMLIDEALESILHWLAEIERLVRPAAMRQNVLEQDDWSEALRLLKRAMAAARAATDPDCPLPASAWGRLVDRDEPDASLDLGDLLLLQRLLDDHSSRMGPS